MSRLRRFLSVILEVIDFYNHRIVIIKTTKIVQPMDFLTKDFFGLLTQYKNRYRFDVIRKLPMSNVSCKKTLLY